MDKMFERYLSSLDSPDLMPDLVKNGIVTFRFRDRAELHDAAKGLGVINMRRDSEPDGVTVVESVPGLADREGFQGLSSAGLELHTDGSGWPAPPRYILLACERTAGSGGESTFVDAQELYDKMATQCPKSLATLSRPAAVVFGSRGEDMYVGPVFSRDDNGNLNVRLRMDSFGYFAYDVLPHLAEMRRMADESLWTMMLQPNEGYIIDNHRLFHGRHAFQGGRRMLRIRFDTHAEAG